MNSRSQAKAMELGKSRNPSASASEIRGLTAVEILTLLAILAAIVLAVLPNILGRLDEARADATKKQLVEISRALERYKIDNQLYPTTEQGLQALVQKPALAPVPRHWHAQGYLRGSVPKDAWGNTLVYESTNGRGGYELYSYGSDGEAGGEEYAADIFLKREDNP